jgi:hypothetical protein
MKDTPERNIEQAVLIRNCLIYAVVWTGICLLATFWNILEIKDNSMELAQKEAKTVLDKDQAFRYWATQHKGVYVPLTEATPPNPYLSHIAERDISTPSGRQLTLINPEYMLRQVMEDYAVLFGNVGHVTSLDAYNPLNAPNEWEAAMLHQFETGKKEASVFIVDDGREVLRVMKPLHTQPGCLHCHAEQGYKEGDVRGGVSVSIPLEPYRQMETSALRTLEYTHLFFWSSGLFIICLSFYRNKKRLVYRLAAEDLLREQSGKIELFAYSVAHDLKNPIIAIQGLSKILNKRHLDGLDEKGRQYCAQIEKSVEQVSALVDQINAFISSKEQPLNKEPLNLLEICRTVRTENEQRLKEKNIAWSEPAGVVTINADRMVILRILRNLVDNALKYGGAGLSSISITHGESERFHTVRVINDGNAIAEEDRRNIFQKFKRSCRDSKVQGTGLGLAIVKDLVGLHGGQVWVESDGIQGATFSFTIAKPNLDRQPPKSPFANRQIP